MHDCVDPNAQSESSRHSTHESVAASHLKRASAVHPPHGVSSGGGGGGGKAVSVGGGGGAEPVGEAVGEVAVVVADGLGSTGGLNICAGISVCVAVGAGSGMGRVDGPPGSSAAHATK